MLEALIRSRAASRLPRETEVPQVAGLPDEKARDHAAARLEKAGIHPAPPHPYWQANGGVEFEDPDGRKVVFVSWVYGSE